MRSYFCNVLDRERSTLERSSLRGDLSLLGIEWQRFGELGLDELRRGDLERSTRDGEGSRRRDLCRRDVFEADSSLS